MIYSPTFILQIVVYALYSLYSYVYGELKEEEEEKNRMIVVRYTYKHYASMRWLRNVWRRVGEWGKKQQQQQQHIQSYNVNASMLCRLAESKQRQNEMKKKTLTN